MASSHNVVLLVDAADLALKDRIKLLSLRLLNFLTCRVGLGHVRWSYRFLNSLGGRCRPPRRSDLRGLGPRSLDEFEEELEACWERAQSSRSSSTQSSRAALTHTALMETLSDFQWDRPDITSPTKPNVPRRRRGGRLTAAEEPINADSPSEMTSPGCRNAVFILSPCPHSRAQLGDFTGPGAYAGLQQVMDKLFSRGLHNMVINKRVTLYWLDTSDWGQVWQTFDHFGYWTMVELMQHVGGKIIPSECLLESSCLQSVGQTLLSRAALNIPFDSVMCSLLSTEQEYTSWFPQQNGLVTFRMPDVVEQWECAVTLEPISTTQNRIKTVMSIHIKGTLKNWTQNQVGKLTLESWLLHNLPDSCEPPGLHFVQLLNTTLSAQWHLVADVSLADELLPRTGIISPISKTAAVLTVICNDLATEFVTLQDETIEELDEAESSEFHDIVNTVISHVFSAKESTTSPEDLMPDWIKQELSQTSPWGSSVTERWYSLSGVTGASSNLMESFRLINAARFDQDDQKNDHEITHYLSELYQKKTEESGTTLQGENQKRLPRTPVRQKMKTMPRALQMLNAARLNSKAQKLQPEGAPLEKSSQAKRRSSEKPEGKPKKPTGFKSEAELNSFLTEDYDKVVSGEEDSVLSFVRNSVTTIKFFIKSSKSKHIETDCIDKIKLLLKTSKMLRQLYGQNPNKVAKLRECQIQALLRLEICVQCPSLQTNEDELEQVVEEITDMLRIISLTEDPSYLTKFLMGVLTEYIGSIPKILADLYFSLGIQIPEELKLVLPKDGDDSFILESQTPMSSQASISRVPSVPLAVNEENQLEELRTRSAKKRRTKTMSRHRSIAESSQSLRQIELPKKPLHKESSSTNPVVIVEKLKIPLSTQTQKNGEATKARRNLFVQENRSPTRRSSKMPRSQSVSAVDGLKHKRSKSHNGTKNHYKLLTKKVTETPTHKQTSNRLLYRQIKGRCRESTSNISVVEESPEKDLTELHVWRSPRLKQLAMTRNSSFYAAQPKSRNLERVHSATQQTLGGGSATQHEVKTPKHLLFGEVLGFSPPPRRARRKLLAEPDPFSNEVLGKSLRFTPEKIQKSLSSCEQSTENRMPRRSPRTPKRTPQRLNTPPTTPVEKKSAAKNLGTLFSPSKMEEKTPSKSTERRSEHFAQTTPSGSSKISLLSSLKSIRQPFTPRKEGVDRSQSPILKSPQKTPQKLANTKTPEKIIETFSTPRKSPRLLSSSPQCVTPSRYSLRTPQKVSETPKKQATNSASTLPYTVACTPKKATFFSPRKTADVLQSHSIETSRLDILSLTPFQPTLNTPRKSSLKDVKLCSQYSTNTCKPCPVKLESPSDSILQTACEAARVLSPTLYKGTSPSGNLDPIVLCERLDMSSMESSEGTESFVNTSQTDLSSDITDARVVSSESCDLKMKVLFKRKSSDAELLNHLPSTPKSEGGVVSTSPYGLRCTIDRRQREAAARLGTPQKISTPKSQKKTNPPPVYEVELEMQASGLPKLRFKRTDSNCTIDMSTLPKSESPSVSRNKKGNESPFGETRCNKHALKMESTCTSPCLRSLHNTPGKSGLQTLICQTYTPKRSSSSTASPSQTEAVSPWTPSPKYKDKNGSDVINNWPRKKKVFPVKPVCGVRQEKNQDSASSAPSGDESSLELEGNKPSPLRDLMVEGVSKPLEQSPVLEWKGTSEIGAMSFKSRKRCFDFLSLTKDEPNSKRSCTLSDASEAMEELVASSSRTLSSEMSSSQQSYEDEVFNVSTFTPPHKVLKSSLSTNSLLALTQSPMLFKGNTPSSKRKKQDCESQNSSPEVKRPAHEAVGMEDSPFGQRSTKRTISRTYSRKRLIP